MFPARFLLIFLLGCLVTDNSLFARAPALFSQDSLVPTNLTITYAINVQGKKAEDIKETYNGGKKTVFINDNNVRVRLVSLMRTQSIFFIPGNNTQVVAVVKESGKDKHKFYLNADQWKSYNGKYEGVTCVFTGKDMQLLGYPCKEAVLTLADQRTISVYYTDSIMQPALALAEPVFSCIPGTVLQYEYIHPNGSIMYTAESISLQPINKEVFKIPVKGYAIRRYTNRKQNKKDAATNL